MRPTCPQSLSNKKVFRQVLKQFNPMSSLLSKFGRGENSSLGLAMLKLLLPNLL